MWQSVRWVKIRNLGLGHWPHLFKLYPVGDNDEVQSERQRVKGWTKAASGSQESTEFKTQEGGVC